MKTMSNTWIYGKALESHDLSNGISAGGLGKIIVLEGRRAELGVVK